MHPPVFLLAQSFVSKQAGTLNGLSINLGDLNSSAESLEQLRPLQKYVLNRSL